MIQTDTHLIPNYCITKVDLSNLGDQMVTISTVGGDYVCSGFRAIEAVYALKPDALEGNPHIKWQKHAWAYHNVVVHPIMQIMVWLGWKKRAIAFHNKQAPKPSGFRNDI